MSGVLVLIGLQWMAAWQPLFWMFLGIVLINGCLPRRSDLTLHNQTTRPCWRTVVYLLSFMILLLGFGQSRLIVVIGISLMVFADLLAALVDQRSSKPFRFREVGDEKSLQDPVAMFLASQALVAAGLARVPEAGPFPIETLGQMPVGVAVVVTIAEPMSFRGLENASVSLPGAIAMHALLQEMLWYQITLGLLFSIVVSLLAWRLRALNPSGALAAVLVGTLVFGLGGVAYAVPLLMFFVLSSLLGHLPRRETGSDVELFKANQPRDAAQVLANGAVPALLAIFSIFYHEKVIFFMYLTSVAAVTADTWATELGIRYGGRPRSLANGKPVSAGTSGGITLVGTLGGLTGAALIALSARILTLSGEDPAAFGLIAMTIAAAITAQFIDSLLGAFLQRRNRCLICGRVTELNRHCGRATQHAAGWRWLTNDVVNFACSASAPALLALSRLVMQ